MDLNSPFKFFWLIYLTLSFPQDNIWKNAEDFIQSSFEPEEFYSANYIQRIRIVPNGNDENWQQKIQLENERLQLGFRMDKTSFSESVHNRKGFVSFQSNEYNFILGNTRIQTGNSLLFGSDYNSIKSPGNLLSPGKIRWKISPYLGSEFSSNQAGITILKNTEIANYYFSVDNSALSTGIRKTGERLNAILIGVMPKEGAFALSFSYHLTNNSVQFSGETALKSNMLAQYFQIFSNDPNINWLGQFRLLPKNWESISGKPFSGFGKLSNETGFLLSVKKNE